MDHSQLSLYIHNGWIGLTLHKFRYVPANGFQCVRWEEVGGYYYIDLKNVVQGMIIISFFLLFGL
jgi:hypothetical protein